MKNKIPFVLIISFIFLTSITRVHAHEDNVHGLIFYDKNEDGKLDGSDIPIPNVYIKIYDKDGKRIRSHETSEAVSLNTNDKGKFNIKNNGNVSNIHVRKPFGVEALFYDGKEYYDDELIIKIDNKKSNNIIINIINPTTDFLKEISKPKHGWFYKWINTISWDPLITTLKTALSGIIFTFIIGMLLVRLIRSIKIKWLKIILDAILTLPLVLPPTVIGFFLLKLLGVNSVIGKFFLSVFDFKIVFSWESTVIAAVVLSLPLMYRSTLGALDQVDTSLIYAARTLGFTERKIFWRVLVPNAIPGVASATILAFARGMGEYGATSMIAGNILGKTQTIPIAVAITTASGQDTQANFYVMVILIIAMILITSMNVITYRISTKGIRR